MRSPKTRRNRRIDRHGLRHCSRGDLRRRLLLAEKLEDRRVLASVFWDGGGDGSSWEDPINWSFDQLPTVADDVTIDLPGEQTIEIESFDAEARSIISEEHIRLIGAATLNVTKSGQMNGGLTHFANRIDVGGDLSLAGDNRFGLNSRVEGIGSLIFAEGSTGIFARSRILMDVDNSGRLTVLPAQGLGLETTFSSNHWLNQPTGILVLQSGGSLDIDSEGSFTNLGTISKTESEPSSLTAPTIANNALIDVSKGALTLDGHVQNDADIQLPSGRELIFDGSADFAIGNTIEGEGTFRLQGTGPFDFTGARFLPRGLADFEAFNAPVTITNTLPETTTFGLIRSRIEFNADQVLSGPADLQSSITGSGDVKLVGEWTINQSSFDGAGRLTLAEDSRLRTFGSNNSIERPFEIAGNLVHLNGSLTFASDTTILPTGRLELVGENDLVLNSDVVLRNQGTLTKTGGGTSDTGFQGELRNENILTAEDGELRLRNSVLHSTTSIDVAASGTIRFAAPITFDPGRSITGEGHLIFDAALDFSDVNIAPSGSIEFRGDVTIGNTLPPETTITSISGTARFNADQTLDSVPLFNNSRIEGTGDLLLTGNFASSRTTFDGSGTVTVEENATWNANSRLTISKPLVNRGHIEKRGGDVFLGSSFVNANTGTVRLLNPIRFDNAAFSVFNEGEIIHLGDGETRFNTGFENRGDLNVQSGKVDVRGAFSSQDAHYTVADAAVLQIRGVGLQLDATSSLRGDGTLEGHVINSGVVAPGTEIGSLTIQGNYAQTASGVIDVDAEGASAAEHDRLIVTGAATLDGTVRIAVAPSYQPQATDTLEVIQHASVSGTPALQVIGASNTAEIQSSPTTTSVTFGEGNTNVVLPTFRGLAEPNSTIELSAQIADGAEFLIGNTQADSDGQWNIQVTNGLGNDRYRIVARNPDEPTKQPLINVFADLGLGELDIEGFESITIFDDSIFFTPFGDDPDGIAQSDDVLIQFDDATARLRFGDRIPSTGADQGKRLRDGTIDLDTPFFRFEGAAVAESKLILGVLPFAIDRIDFNRVDGTNGQSIDEFEVSGRFRTVQKTNASIEGAPQGETTSISSQEKEAFRIIREHFDDVANSQATGGDVEFDAELIESTLLEWLNPSHPESNDCTSLESQGLQCRIEDLSQNPTPGQFDATVREFLSFSAALSSADGLASEDLKTRAETLQSEVSTATGRLVVSLANNISATTRLEDFRNFINQYDTLLKLIDDQEQLVPTEPGEPPITEETVFQSISKNFFTGAMARSVNATISQRSFNGISDIFDIIEISGSFLEDAPSDNSSNGDEESVPVVGDLAKEVRRLIDQLIEIANLEQNSRAAATVTKLMAELSERRDEEQERKSKGKAGPEPFTTVLISLAEMVDLLELPNRYTFPVVLDALPFPSRLPEDQITLVVGDLPKDENGFTFDSVFEFFDRSGGEDLSLITPNQTRFKFAAQFNDGDFQALDLPAIGIAFQKTVGVTTTAGIVSLDADFGGGGGLVTEIGFDALIDVVGEEGIEGDFGVEVTGSFKAYENISAALDSEATIELGFKTDENLSDSFFLDADVDATFTLDIDIGLDSGLQSFDIGLAEIEVENFAAAFGGTPTSDITGSKVPDDAFLVLTGQPDGDTPAVTLDLRQDAEHLLSFGRVQMEVPNAGVPLGRNKETNTPGVALIVENFFLDLDDTGVTVSRDTGFSAEVENLGNAFEELGIPDFVVVKKLAFEGGPGFQDGTNLLDFQLVMSLDVNLPIEVPVSASFDNVVIDVAAVSQGDFLDALRFGPPGSEEFSGIRVSIGPVEFSDSLKFAGDIAIGQFGYTPLDENGNPLTGEEESSLAFFLSGSFDVGTFAGINGSVFLSEYGPIAMSLGIEGFELPIFNTGLAFKSFEGSILLNAPDFPVIENPLQLLDQSAEFDFQSLANELSFEQMVDRARDLVVDNSQRLARQETPLTTWETDLLLAVSAGIGIAGDPTNTLAVKTTIGARIEVEQDPNEESRGFQMFGLGTATVLPEKDNEVNLGTAALLLEFPSSGPIASFAFQINPEESTVPVEAKIGGQVRGVFDEQGEYLSTEVRIAGSAKAKGVAEGEIGGILVFEPRNFFGVFGFEFEIGQSEDLKINGDLFVQMNTSGTFQELDRDAVESIEALDELIVGEEAPGVEPGFELFARVGVAYTDILDVQGRLNIKLNEQGFTAGVNLEGKLFGGVIEASLVGEMTSDESGFDLLFDLEASIILVPEFLEATGAVMLEIKDDRFRRFEGDVSATIFGLETSAGLAINQHACMALSFQDGFVELPLLGGDCGITDEPDPTVLTVGDVTHEERNTSIFAANVPVQFEDRRRITVPDGIEPVVMLDVWAFADPEEDTATEGSDFTKISRKRFEVPLTFHSRNDVLNLSLYDLPKEFFIPIDVIGDQLVEDDETFHVFVQVAPVGVFEPPKPGDARLNAPIVRGDDGFAEVTILNDDTVPEPPEDAIVFFDFETVLVTSTELLLFPENLPDASRPEFTFDLDAVSPITHSANEVRFNPDEGLPIEVFSTGRAATADLWLTYINQEEGEQVVEPPFQGQSTLIPDGEENREYFEFTITPNEGDADPNLRIDGIDFWNQAEFGGGNWEVKYNADNFQSVLASGTVTRGFFARERVLFDYPLGFDGILAPGEPITFRIYGPSSGPLGAGASIEQVVNEWRIDNLALIGGTAFTLDPTIDDIQVDAPVELLDTTTGSVPVEETEPPPIIIPEFIPPLPPPIPPLGFIGFGFNGFLSGAETWFDANLDGEVTPGEPNGEADAVGRARLLVGSEFDLNGNGKVDLSEGVITSRAGLDTAKGITQTFSFRAPYGSRSITPLTTLATALSQNHGLSPQEANAALIAAIQSAGKNVPIDFNVFNDASIVEISKGSSLNLDAYLSLVQVHQTVALLAPLFAETSGSLEDAGRLVFAELATRIASEGDLDLLSPLQISELIRAVAPNATDDLIDAIATVASSANQALATIVLPAGKDFLTRVNQIEKFVFVSVVNNVKEVIEANRSIEDLLAQYTVDRIASDSTSESIGPVLPVAVRVQPGTIVEPDNGTAQIEFLVSLSAPTLVPVSIDFRTLDRSAQTLTGDYDSTSGTLVFAPGETAKTISVAVHADDVVEKVESFYLQFRNPTNALLTESQVLGRILPSTDEVPVPDELRLESKNAAVGEPVTVAIRLPGLVGGTVNWGDGTIEPVSLQESDVGTLLAVQHRYDVEGDYVAELTLEFQTGQQTQVQQELFIRDVTQIPDPNQPGKFVIEITGTETKDFIQVKLEEQSSQIAAYLNQQLIGRFVRESISGINIQAGAGSDLVWIDHRVDIPVFVDAGPGNDVVFTGRGDDIVLGGDGRDKIFVRAGDDSVDAGSGNDFIHGSSGNDRLLGGDGNDRINGGDGTDELIGSLGRDILLGGNDADVLSGGEDKDRLLGGRGNDFIDAGSGNDFVLAGPGENSVFGREGADTIYGGHDRDRIFGGEDGDRLIGGLGDDLILGEAGNDTVFGGLGNDLLQGGDGNDFIHGSFGDDRLLGEAGNDRLVGGPGNDQLIGGPGQDVLHGGPGENELFDNEAPEVSALNVDESEIVQPPTYRDVNQDGRITALDALLVINELNRRNGTTETQLLNFQFDANNDGRVSALDALIIINYLNSTGSAQDDLETVGDEEVASLLDDRGAKIDEIASDLIASILGPSESDREELVDDLLMQLDLVATLV